MAAHIPIYNDMDSVSRDVTTLPYDHWSPSEMAGLIWKMCKKEWGNRTMAKGFLSDFNEFNQLTINDLYVWLALAVVMTLMRYAISSVVMAPLAEWLAFKENDKKKFTESASKLVFWLIFVGFEWYLVNNQYPKLRYIPGEVWNGSKIGFPIPEDINLIYTLQAAFYFHAIYATIFMDKWKSDSVPMIFHHVLANALIIFSLAVRYHRVGLLVLYLHDPADVFLEGTKVLTCFNNRRKTWYWDWLVTMGFIGFSSIWFYFRLWVYPQLILFSVGYVSVSIVPAFSKFYFYFNGMLLALFVLNVWWFNSIIVLIVKILMGKERIQDTREDDCVKVGDDSEKKTDEPGDSETKVDAQETCPYIQNGQHKNGGGDEVRHRQPHQQQQS